MATESQIEAFIHAWKTGFISDTMKLVFDYAEWKRVEVGGDRGPWVPFSQGEVETFLQLHRSGGNRFAPLVRAKALILLPENMIGTYYKYPQGTNPGVILPTKPDGWAAQVAFDTADGIADDIINTSYGWIKVGRPPQGGNLHLGASCVDQEDQSE
jgi:hypothetical protein